MKPIYLDHCSTTPIDPDVLDAMMPFLRESYGNPGTPHHLFGGVAQKAVRAAREQAAELISCRPNELVWTSGATEANNLAILGFAEKAHPRQRHLITQVTEHSAVLEPFRYLESHGWDVTYLPVNDDGEISIACLEESITEATSLVSIMWGNNEVGTIQPVEEVASLCQKQGIAFHCDAAQAVGKIAIELDELPISLLTFSGHKIYGPKGVGALFIRDLSKNQLVSPRSYGGGQEKGVRPGTLNVPAVVGIGKACELAISKMGNWTAHVGNLRDCFEASLLAQLPEVEVNCQGAKRLPHISNIAFSGIDNEGLLTMLPNIVASTGSACHVADFEPSHVLTGIGARDLADCSVRFGFGKGNTIAEIDQAIESICDAVHTLRVDIATDS